MAITELQLDALREMGNIGAGHAATALSDFLQRRIDMSVPRVWVLPLQQLQENIGELDALQAAVYLRVEGEASGKAVFFFPVESAEVIVQSLLDSRECVDFQVNEMAQSALKEVGNVMVSSFLIALTRFTGIIFYPSVPVLAVDMIGAVLDGIFLEQGTVNDVMLFIDTQFSGIPRIEGKFFFLPDDGSLEKMLGAIGL